MKFANAIANTFRGGRNIRDICLPHGLVHPEDVHRLDDAERLLVAMPVVWSRIQTIRYERTFQGEKCLIFARIEKRFRDAVAIRSRSVSRIQMSVTEIKSFFGNTDDLPLRTFRRDGAGLK